MKECEEGVRVGSQVVGCRWHSLTGLRPQRLAMPLCSVLLLQRGDIKKKKSASLHTVGKHKMGLLHNKPVSSWRSHPMEVHSHTVVLPA